MIPMKTTIKVIALLIAAGYPCVAFAEFAGASIPSALNAENALIAFSIALAVLLMIGDYSRRAFAFNSPARLGAKPVTRSKRESHRLAA